MLIVLDADGVILNASWEVLYRAYQEVIFDLGKTTEEFFKDINQFKKWWNPNWRTNNRNLGIINEKRASMIFYRAYGPSAFIFPWAEEIVKKLAENNLLAILTNGSKNNVLRHTGKIINYFWQVVSAEDVKKLKPDPEGLNIIARAASRLGVKKKDILFIGDTMEDVMAGRAAEVKTGAVKWGLGDWDELCSLNPDYKFEKPEDLLLKKK